MIKLTSFTITLLKKLKNLKNAITFKDTISKNVNILNWTVTNKYNVRNKSLKVMLLGNKWINY